MDSILKFIKQLVEWLSILKIIAAPVIIGSIAAFVFYLYMPNQTGNIISVVIFLSGLVTGIVLALRIRKNSSAVEFNARVSASPDLDDLKKNKK